MSELTKNHRRMLTYLLVSNFLLYFGFQIWQVMFNNFAVEELSVDAGGIGWIQSLRELPGLMGFLLGFLALYLSETRLMAFSVIMMGVGLLMTSQSQGIVFFLISTVLMSTGFHFFYPSSNLSVEQTCPLFRTPWPSSRPWR